MDTISSVLAEVERAWRAYGVSAADRTALAEDLRSDLTAAAEEGAGPRALIGGDVGAFARRLADEAGVRRTLPEYGRVIVTALAGTALAGIVGAAILYGFFPVLVDLADLDVNVPVQVAVGAYYGLPAAVVVAGAVIAVRVHLSALPRIRATVTWMSGLLPVAGILITPVTMGFAWATGYSLAPVVVLTEAGLALGALAAATALGRYLALRRPDTPAPRPAGIVSA